MRRRSVHWTVMLALAVALGAGSAWAAKGGNGGGKPGGGGSDGGDGGGIADQDVVLLFQDQDDGAVYVGDLQGNVEKTIAWKGDKPSTGAYSWALQEPHFGPSGTTKIVFNARFDGGGIYLADDFAGGNAWKLVATSRRVTYPSWSNGDAPNGEPMIAYRDMDAAGDDQLFVTTLDGVATQLTSWPNLNWRSVAWNPATNDELLVVIGGRFFLVGLAADGGDLYVTSLRDPLRGRDYALTVDGGLDYDTDGNVKFTPGIDVTAGTALEGLTWSNPHFSADGKTIAFSAMTGTNKENEVWTLTRHDDGTHTVKNLLDGALDVEAFAAGILPDGRVLFSKGGGSGWRLWVIDSDGTDAALFYDEKAISVVNVEVRR